MDRHHLPGEASEGNEGYIFGFAAVLVFLFLAALYESWSIPFAVLLAVPLGIFGALLGGLAAGVPVRHLHADRHRDADRTGGEERDSDCGVRQGCGTRRACPSRCARWKRRKLRLRPILMTSFAFILGVLPLVIATGAGAARGDRWERPCSAAWSRRRCWRYSLCRCCMW